MAKTETPSGGPSGVLVVDKARGPTSHDVVGRARALLRTREVGHAGTLDPMATGVLVLGVREGTKLLPYLTAHDKTYEARVVLGESTETLDAEGAVRTHEAVAPWLVDALARLARVEGGALPPGLVDALDAERGRREQIPPAFSAIRKDGVRAHALARAGVEVALDPRPVRVHALEVTAGSVDPPTLSVRVTADKGYYVRSLGRDLALALGTVGHLSELRRVRSGPFGLGGAVALDPDAARGVIDLATAAALALPTARLDGAAVLQARRGQRVALPEDAAQGPCAWLDDAGALVAIGERAPEGHGRVLRGFAPPLFLRPPPP